MSEDGVKILYGGVFPKTMNQLSFELDCIQNDYPNKKILLKQHPENKEWYFILEEWLIKKEVNR